MRPKRSLWMVSSALVVSSLAGCGPTAEPPAGSADSADLGGSPAAVESTPGAGACELVTREDASALFGQPASPHGGPSGAAMFDQCLWSCDTEGSNQLLQFSIWDPLAYSPPDDSEPLDLGDGGYLRAHPLAGVDINWLQGGRMISLSYSTVGPEAPEATSRVEQVAALARLVESRL